MPSLAVDAYLRELDRVRAQPEATKELSLRVPLARLLESLASDAGLTRVLVTPEASAGAVGQPDYFIKSGPRLVGFVETKEPGADLGKWLGASDQATRYLASLPNWLLTDYYRFILIRDGAPIAQLELESPDGQSSFLQSSSPQVAEFFGQFFGYSLPFVRRPKVLAVELARRARLIRDSLLLTLGDEGKGVFLRSLRDFYRETLMNDLTDEDFADTFAQTIVYGLLIARLRDDDTTFTLDEAADALPRSIPVLRGVVRLAREEEVAPTRLRQLIEDVVAVLENTDVSRIREGIEIGGVRKDPVIYFYEDFLEAYDHGERKKRGVYYTPSALVEYIVRGVDDVLRSRIGIPEGLVDERVTVLDPAAGTGTFLLGIAEHILAAAEDRGTAWVKHVVTQHVIPHLSGFELLPAPYTIAHLKLATFLHGKDYELRDDERLRVYLTNTLEPYSEQAHGQMSLLPMTGSILEEGRAAGGVKENERILVIVGNPPYSKSRHNSNSFIDSLMQSFYEIDGERLSDRNTQPLQDDYLRFLRWSVWKLLEQQDAPGHGVIAFVTNRAFLDRQVHRAVRKFLLDRFDEIHILDLHGDQREWIRGAVDEKTFPNVQAGISLTLLIKRPADVDQPPLATVRYRGFRGTRKDKLKATAASSLDDAEVTALSPSRPLWLFTPYEVPEEYATWPSLRDIFPVSSYGVVTSRDKYLLAADRLDLERRLAELTSPALPDSYFEQQRVKDTRDWSLSAARTALRDGRPTRIVHVHYQGLNRVYAALDERLVEFLRHDVSRHMLVGSQNVALVYAKEWLADGAYAIVSRGPGFASSVSFGTVGAADFAPLFLFDGDTRTPNLSEQVVDNLRPHLGDVSPEQLLGYIYGVLNSPRYRSVYAAALRRGIPRIPFARSRETFVELSALGQRLVDVHLLESPELEKAMPRMEGNDQATVGSAVHDPSSNILRIAPDLHAHGITQQMWDYQQGSYRVLDKFLKYRKGKTFSRESFVEFSRVAASVRLTLELAPELDRVAQQAAAAAVRIKSET